MTQFHDLNLAWWEIEATMETLAQESLDNLWYATWSDCLYRFSDLVIQAMWNYERNIEDREARDRYQYIQKTLRQQMNMLDRALIARSSMNLTEDPSLRKIVKKHKSELAGALNPAINLESDERELSATYGQLEGSTSIWDGAEELSLRAAQQRLGKLTNLDQRKELWLRIQEGLFELSAEADKIIEKLLGLRAEIAEAAGCSNYLEYVWKQTQRPFDVESARRIVDDVDTVLTPIYRDVLQSQAKAEDPAELRPWMYLQDGGQGSSHEWTESEYSSLAISVFERINPSFGECLKRIRDAGHLDLMARPKKSNRNFSTLLGQTDQPLIFTNISGSLNGFRVLFHECGHALHYFFSSNSGHGWYFERLPSKEVMELVAYAFQAIAIEELGRSGELQEAQTKQLRQYAAQHALQTIMRGNKLEKIQQWLYLRPNHERVAVSQIDDYWMALNSESRSDWQGFDHFLRKRWQGGHFIRYPLNNITYTIALLSMPMITDRYRQDPQRVITSLKDILYEGSSCNIASALTEFNIGFPFKQADVVRAGMAWKAELQP